MASLDRGTSFIHFATFVPKTSSTIRIAHGLIKFPQLNVQRSLGCTGMPTRRKLVESGFCYGSNPSWGSLPLWSYLALLASTTWKACCWMFFLVLFESSRLQIGVAHNEMAGHALRSVWSSTVIQECSEAIPDMFVISFAFFRHCEITQISQTNNLTNKSKLKNLCTTES